MCGVVPGIAPPHSDPIAGGPHQEQAARMPESSAARASWRGARMGSAHPPPRRAPRTALLRLCLTAPVWAEHTSGEQPRDTPGRAFTSQEDRSRVVGSSPARSARATGALRARFCPGWGSGSQGFTRPRPQSARPLRLWAGAVTSVRPHLRPGPTLIPRLAAGRQCVVLSPRTREAG
jgi:hypothetical protein